MKRRIGLFRLPIETMHSAEASEIFYSLKLTPLRVTESMGYFEIIGISHLFLETDEGFKVPEYEIVGSADSVNNKISYGVWKVSINEFDLNRHLRRQREWSAKTFGPGERTKGIVAHIKKELEEILENPNDLTEWIDVVILALDGAWRIGATTSAIINALRNKQALNESRQWPDWRTATPDQAIEHIKADAP